MEPYDFDLELQKVFNDCYAEISHADWKKWLDITSREEYESAALEMSGLFDVDDLDTRVKTEVTDPRKLSVDVDVDGDFKSRESINNPVVLCHTSGTSGGHISDLKWFHLPLSLVKRLWAPGMEAIFEASGLDRQSSAVIFTPSRTQFDGLSIKNGVPVIKVYSAEFSQRLVLSVVNPRSYLLYEYKKASTLEVIARMLSMDRIAVVSAPSSTVLNWADKNKLRRGLEKSLKCDDPVCSEYVTHINRRGLDTVATEIHTQLKDVLKNATVIFSTTAVTEKEWRTLRKFFEWEKGGEKYTNLYVGSEVGPFAAHINDGNPQHMQVFPLTVPVIQKNGCRDLISRTKERVGQLLISRTDGVEPVINIDTGDVITVLDQEGLPVIGGEVLRAQFQLKVDVSISPVTTPDSRILVGSYFDINGIEIKNPRRLWACLADRCGIDGVSSVLMKPEGDTWVLAVFVPENCSPADIENGLASCPGGESLGKALKDGQLHIEMAEKDLVEWGIPRSELLKKVREGELPKGVLKKWPLYVVSPPASNL